MRTPLVNREAAVLRFVNADRHPKVRTTAWSGFRLSGDLRLKETQLPAGVLTPSGAKPFFALLGPQLRSVGKV